MGSLSEAQRKMCVQFLANSNVEIDEQNEEYVATVKIYVSGLKLRCAEQWAAMLDLEEEAGERWGEARVGNLDFADVSPVA